MKNLFVWASALCIISISAVSCQSDNFENEAQLLPSAAQYDFVIEEGFTTYSKKSVNIGGIELTQVEDHLLYGGDIVISQEQAELLAQPKTRGTISSDLVRLWTNSVVYYTIAADFPNAARITEAINHWEANTNIRFVQRPSNIANYIEIISGSGNWSYIGMIGGKQQLSLSTAGSVGNAIHEIGHAVGMFHEHARSDRDKYIKVIYSNIAADKVHNFDTYIENGYKGVDVGAFDFGSVMLYNSWAFSIDGTATMVNLSGFVFNAQRNGLSTGDITAVNSAYGIAVIPTVTPTTTTTKSTPASSNSKKKK